LVIAADASALSLEVGRSPATEATNSAHSMRLEALYREHAGFVWRTLRRFGLSDADAHDASQEVFLTVHRCLVAFEARSAVTTWLYTICRSVVRDGRRRAFRRHEVTDPLAHDALASEAPGDDADCPAAAAERRERFATLLAILGELDEAQREVFALFELEGMSGEAIAAALGIPVGTVASRLRLARRAFDRACARHMAAESFSEQRMGVPR
jgi:RNA polymerase sigma-70 factor (ECF subfamily)